MDERGAEDLRTIYSFRQNSWRGKVSSCRERLAARFSSVPGCTFIVHPWGNWLRFGGKTLRGLGWLGCYWALGVVRGVCGSTPVPFFL